MNRNNAGFSLVEALITLLVLSVGLLGLGQLQARLWTGAGDLHRQENAYLLGENLLETDRLTWLTDRPLKTSGISVNTVRYPAGTNRDSRKLTTIDLTLQWHQTAGVQSLTLSTTVNSHPEPGYTRCLLVDE